VTSGADWRERLVCSDRRAESIAFHLKHLHNVLVGCRDLRRIGSAALDMCAVAVGRLDAYYEHGIHIWDIAAATLIVREAGGVVCDPYGGDCAKVRMTCLDARNQIVVVIYYFTSVAPAVEFVGSRSFVGLCRC
jgi:fructose-1,6-bisphosphatase/inositol monophosphatase family enzyme